jgi:Glucanosyltransferase
MALSIELLRRGPHPLQDQYLETIQAFSKYNTFMLAYNLGNEVVTAPNETVAATFVKAAARDVKVHLRMLCQGCAPCSLNEI